MDYDLTICIPTFERQKFLFNAIKSCVRITKMKVELLVGDDSKASIEHLLLAEIELPKNYCLKYIHNSVSLGQNKNVDNLFKIAKGKYITLLHDDDELLEDTLSVYKSCIDLDYDNVLFFGNQKLMTNDGFVLDDNRNLEFNKSLGRSNLNYGFIKDSCSAIIKLSVPGSAFLVQSCIAREVGYLSYDRIGDACDFDFLARVYSQVKARFFFLECYVSVYRLSSISVSTSICNNATYYKHKSIIVNGLLFQSLFAYFAVLRRDFFPLISYVLRQYLNKRSFNIQKKVIA